MTDHETQWHLIELMNELYRLAVNDQIKFIMYNDFAMKSHLRGIIYNGNEVEKDYALKLI